MARQDSPAVRESPVAAALTQLVRLHRDPLVAKAPHRAIWDLEIQEIQARPAGNLAQMDLIIQSFVNAPQISVIRIKSGVHRLFVNASGKVDPRF